MILLLIIPLLILWCSICEWSIHRYVMHKPPFGFEYAYTAHTKVHHNIYKSDETYHAQEGDDGKKIPMAWWNGIVISILACLKFFCSRLPIAVLALPVIKLYNSPFLNWLFDI